MRLSRSDGALQIAEADHKFGKDGQVSVGAWRYTAPLPALDGGPDRRDAGLFGLVEGSAPGLENVKGWIRAGRGDPNVQLVSGYFGAGLVKTGPFAARKDDSGGLRAPFSLAANDAQRGLA